MSAKKSEMFESEFGDISDRYSIKPTYKGPKDTIKSESNIEIDSQRKQPIAPHPLYPEFTYPHLPSFIQLPYPIKRIIKLKEITNYQELLTAWTQNWVICLGEEENNANVYLITPEKWLIAKPTFWRLCQLYDEREASWKLQVKWDSKTNDEFYGYRETRTKEACVEQYCIFLEGQRQRFMKD